MPLHDFQCQPVEALCIEGTTSVNNLVKHTSEAPHITFVAVRLVVDELRRHVKRRADLCLGQICCGVQHARDAEVSQFRCKDLLRPVPSQKDILSLQITVQDPLLVQGVQGEGRVDEPLQEPALVWRPTSLLGMLQVSADVSVFAILHEDAEVCLRIHKGISVSNDVWVPHGTQQLHLHLSLLSLACIHGCKKGNLFHDILPHLKTVHDQEDLAKRSAADGTHYLILALQVMLALKLAIPCGRHQQRLLMLHGAEATTMPN
mmetsp:Transcript_80625/g.152292  ORF Transcript_80625/g.152292 Transcript_80625/m.152292 type:complete len:261 (-) Transcript_80625:59-841(-)